MRHVGLPLFLSFTLCSMLMAQTAPKPLNVKIVPGQSLKRETPVPSKTTYEIVSEPKKEIPIETPIETPKPTPAPVEKPKTEPLKRLSDSKAPVVSNLPTSVRYIGTGLFEVSFDVNEPCFLENGSGGVMVWLNGVAMERVSGTLTASGEHYVFQTTIAESTPIGPTSLTIKATDKAGNTSETINTLFVVYPDISNTGLQFVKEESLDIELAVNKVLSKIQQAEVSAYLNNQPMSIVLVSPFEEGEKYLFRIPITENTAEGLATTLFRVKDGAGNLSEIQTQQILVDTTPPRISDISPESKYRGEGPVEIRFKVNEPVSLPLGKSDIQATFNGEPMKLISLQYDKGTETYSYQAQINATTKEGPATILIQAQDPAGNQSIVQDSSVIVDLTKPKITNVAVGKRFVSNETVTLQFDINKHIVPGIENAKIQVLLNDVPMTQQSVRPLKQGARYQYQASIGKQETQGPAIVQILLTDAVGNTLSHYLAETETLVIDTIAPDISFDTETRYIPAGEFQIEANLSEAISKQMGAKNISAWFNKKRLSIAETTPVNEGETVAFRTQILPTEQQGPGILSIRATDQAGNTTEVSSNHLVIDTIPPVISGIPTEKQRITSGTLSIGFGINEKLSPGVGKTTIRAEFNGQDMTPQATKSNEFGNWHTFTFPVTDSTPQGEAEITLYVSDASGNKVKANYPGIFIDSKPAVLNPLKIQTTPESTKVVVPEKQKSKKKSRK